MSHQACMRTSINQQSDLILINLINYIVNLCLLITCYICFTYLS